MSIEQFAFNAAVIFWFCWKMAGAFIRLVFGDRRDEPRYNTAAWPLVRLPARPDRVLVGGRWI